MALAAGDTNVVEMTKALGRIFRYAAKGADLVPFAEEMEIIKSARIWLLQVPAESGRSRMETIHFEWSDPSVHLSSSN